MNWLDWLFMTPRQRYVVKLAKRKDFYKSREWRELRYKALRKHGWRCQSCGRTPKKHGVVLHVDHRYPKSLFPCKAMSLSNLQIGCEDCNIGKSKKYFDDWRC